jgi:hypothetical protein
MSWHELSSPYTEANAENVSETTLVHEPFFDEASAQINVTTQLGSDVILHCRVNDLRERMVGTFYYSTPPPSLCHDEHMLLLPPDFKN